MILKIIIIIIMLIGLYCTAFPKLSGTLIILAAAIAYWLLTGFSTYQLWLAYMLIGLAFVAEIGGRMLRIYLTQHEGVTRTFSTDTTVGNIAGLIVADAILGPFTGTILWELMVGKNLFPRWTTVSKVLKKLAMVALMRFICANIMVFIVIKYIFL
ncbi:hypothetical protein SPFL3102_01049 [Sporomusaceae bacterium FL31]|nr:hypothetical protein SPFL3101_00342 [Sporomusaceae bacterium FL31]GCE33246.1 hypothetical protein SPFL3102_01049 [Sporomusaceae bacterium]